MRRLLGVVVLAVVAWHAWSKVPEHRLAEMLYTCHVASVLIGVGILLEHRMLVAVGFLFHLAVGFPSWLLDLFVSGTDVSGVIVHVVPLVAGGWEARRLGIPPRAALGAWALFVVCSVVSFFATDPALNVNVVHAPWPPFRALGRAGTWALNGALSLTLILIAERVTPWRTARA